METRRGRTAGTGSLAGALVCAALVAAACGGSGGNGGGSSQAAVSPSPTAQPSSVATPTPQPEATPSAADGVPTITTNHIQQSGSSGPVDFKEPVVGGVAGADAMNVVIGDKVAGYIDGFTSSGGSGSLTGEFTVELASPTLLSLRFDVTEDTGGMHPTEYAGAVSFRVPSGEEIAFVSLFADEEAALTQLNEAVHDALTAELGDDMQWDYVDDLGSVADAFALSEDGLELGWSKGGASDEAHGVVWILLSWPDVEGIIDPAGPAAEFEP
jgi:hypothetical protein